MLRRVRFKPKAPPPRPGRQYEGADPSRPRAPAPRIADLSARAVVPIEKPAVKSKPGKGAPTVVEKKWLDAITNYGCVACHIDGHPPRPTAVHHILRGGRRIGHLFSIGLCDPGHHQGGAEFGLISRHPYKARFEARYGTELDLLATLKTRLGFFDDWKAS